VSVLKILLGNVLMDYDFKTETGVRPTNFAFHLSELPDMKAKLMFRRREFNEDGG
jgi:hypothetical protein